MRPAVLLAGSALAAPAAAGWLAWRLHRERRQLRAWRAAAEDAGRRAERTREQLAAVVAADPVTGLPTPAACTALLHAAQRTAAREERQVALLHVALDGFRAFNAGHGRAAGDAVLAEVARRLRRAVRGSDEVGRLGGDEFAVLVTDPAAAVDVAVRLLAVLAEPHDVGALPVRIAASIGVAHPLPGAAPQELLLAAEQAAGEAKAAGGGCVRVFDALPALRGEAERAAARRLRRALAADPADPAGPGGPDGRVEVHYQPSVDVDSRVVSGVECLVRWRRDGRLVGPDEFIGLAERHGVVAELGRAVLARAVRDAPALAAAAGRDLVVAVNVSAPQLEDPLLLPAVRAAVAALGGCPLVLEMTEGMLVAEDRGTQDALDALAATGAHLAVDDFGTGCATLAYLRRRPFTAFKVDRSYVRDLETDSRTRALVEGLVLLAATTGMGLVVEGVETPGQARLLQAMGAPTQQGFLHARPGPLEQAVATIARLRERLGAARATGDPPLRPR
ncbi:EAL domain-containing protein [Kineococcus sp. SYSU DK006]|uniref:EAL domain-containing protein n=1 Tax=Kineococcus sp. SYSU DK006 TaxID=3383127 RepID=UPI003D7D7D59